ncbi:MAG: hypothetical protein JXC36_06080 [Candidatus Atribacteria bacterium]|nr:hypothetical protein [Candidatus Atribacteria bacterium]
MEIKKDIILSILLIIVLPSFGQNDTIKSLTTKKIKVEKIVSDSIMARYIKADVIKVKNIDVNNSVSKQIGVKNITLDFQNKEFTSNLKELDNIKKGDFYKLTIKNINMNLYEVNIKKKDSIIISEVTFPTFDMVNLGGVDEILNKLGQIVISEKQMDYKKSKDLIQLFPGNELDLLPGLRNEIKERINIEKLYLETKLKSIDNINRRIDNLSLNVQKKTYSYLVKDPSMTYFKELSGKVPFDTILSNVTFIRTMIEKLIKELENKQSGYNTFISDEKIKILFKTDEELSKANKNLLEVFSNVISSAKKTFEGINSDRVSTWINSIIFKENNFNELTYTTLPQQFNGDITRLKIYINQRNSSYGLPSYNTEIVFPQVKQFFLGLGMSFYYGNFVNVLYSIKASLNDTSTTYSIVDEENKAGELGVTTLLHIGYRPFINADWFALNLVTGPALSLTNTVKPRVAAGGGISFGMKKMFSINLLYIGGYTEVKSNVYNTSEIYVTKPEKVTVSKFKNKFGLSFGLIYKF